MSRTPKALVVMSLPLHRAALGAVLEPHAAVVGEAWDVDSALSVLATTRADVVITEFGLHGGGAELCATIKGDDGHGQSVRVLVIGGHLADDSELVEAVHAGADGYVSEVEGAEALCEAVGRVARGEASIPGAMLGSLLRALIKDRREQDEAVERFARLSMREREVAALIADGLDNAAIGERMFVSQNTARTHVQNILRKLEVGSRLEVASMVVTFGLLDRFPVEGKEQR